ncbi:hypothetical protein HYFRA_00011584 [Hymenoscyphus fraxineus]|uniref:Uncharacterized protein n=1 Tax=Hymenoscyphus fraxineus TaxID=746836 RepID=A0A9N9L546_9HELO|nr:hypothetical protein HYFRA_00011584 [Hymenoscyphus fraxineus]
MKTVIPSLVASSTVGVAAVGLAFARQERTSNPTSNKRVAGDPTYLSILNNGNGTASPSSRPATMSSLTPNRSPLQPSTEPSESPEPPSSTLRPTSTTPRNDLPPSSHARVRRHTIFRQGDGSSPSDGENKRDSGSSRGSWMARRFSAMPTSYNTSPRSSVGPDSPSITHTNGSAAPILAEPDNSPAQLPPNKLVKRASSGKKETESRARSGSKSKVPTLRRPATSYQRSANLMEQFRNQSSDDPLSRNQSPEIESTIQESTKSSNTSPNTAHGSIRASFWSNKASKLGVSSWRPFFQRKSVRFSKDRLAGQSTSKRILVDDSVRPTLVTPDVINCRPSDDLYEFGDDSLPLDSSLVEETEEYDTNVPSVDSKRPRRSLSFHFGSPNGLLSKTGSMGGNKRNAEGRSGGKRHSSAPVSALPGRNIMSADGHSTNRPMTMDFFGNPAQEYTFDTPTRRLSGKIELEQQGGVPVTDETPEKAHLVDNSPIEKIVSQLATLDQDAKYSVPSEDDDIDFFHETVFDSLTSRNTGSTGRSRNATLDSMFDESPPSLQGQLNIPLIRNKTHASIVEEDEDMSTPIRESVLPVRDGFSTPIRPTTADSDIPSSPPSFCLATKDFGRLSLDDEEDDEDWTKEDDMGVDNRLSPPSNSNSFRMSASFRAALADVSGNSMSGVTTERPRSNLFDWSEPSNEKLDSLGRSPRPRTANANQLLDTRGGRTPGRRGPTPIHIRSQSVPVVPDATEHSKLTPKFGTWGLGGKGVSEDWDNDFDFDIPTDDEGDDSTTGKSGMFIPPTIQASQATVVGHVGHIREVCLLVEDLKRLRLLGKEKGLLDGPSAGLWKEAEGIIALAVPDEEDLDLSTPSSPTSMVFNRDASDGKLSHEHEDLDFGDDDLDFGHDYRQTSKPIGNLAGSNERSGGSPYDVKTLRRRSVFTLDDDIFGADTNSPRSVPLPHSPCPSCEKKKSSEVARTVMETMHQHRAISDPLVKEMAAQSANKMPFDTTSLRDLVHRAGILTRTLGEIIRRADGRALSPDLTPHRESSPAFTRVFTDPQSGTPKSLPRNQSNNSMLNNSPLDSSPSRSIGQRMHMMTVV